MLTIPPTELWVTFIGGPWDGVEREGGLDDLADIPPTWNVRVGGEDGCVVGHIYHLVKVEEWPSGKIRFSYKLLDG